MRIGRRFKIVLFGIVLPMAAFFVVYREFVVFNYYTMFDLNGLRSFYYIHLINGATGPQFYPADIVVVGDSTAKSGIDPRALTLRTVNISANAGSALSSYQTLLRYLEVKPPPRCVLMVHQYNWRHTRELFFQHLVLFDMLGWRDLNDIWRRGAEHGVFPATEYTRVGFFFQSFRHMYKLARVPLPQLQRALWSGASRERMEQKVALLDTAQGFQNNSRRHLPTEANFVNQSMHEGYLRPFEPDPTEDFYLRELAKLSAERKIRLVYTSLPVSESEILPKTENFFTGRDAHVHALLSDFPEVSFIELPRSMSRINFFDFTHLNWEGANAIGRKLNATLRELCAAR
jgi:hypothetical protein